MTPEQRKQVQRLQENLFTIRVFAGWSAEDLAGFLDVTKQTVYNLERGKPKMSLVQYLAIRKILEDETTLQPDNELLQDAVTALLDTDDYSSETLDELEESMRTIARGMTKNADNRIARKLAHEVISSTLTSVGIVAAQALLTKGGGMNWSMVIRGLGKK